MRSGKRKAVVDGVSWESVATTTRTTPSRQEGNTLLDTAMVFYNDIHQKYFYTTWLYLAISIEDGCHTGSVTMLTDSNPNP